MRIEISWHQKASYGGSRRAAEGLVVLRTWLVTINTKPSYESTLR